jgi:hypothetical protein
VTNSKPYFAPLTIRGQEYSFAHLDPFKVMVDSRAVGRLVSVHVRFTTHCFTQGFDPEVHPADEPVIVDEGNRQRAFCDVRYGLSAHLPAAIQGLNHPQARVYQTGVRRNWLHSATVHGHDGPYHIFFEIRRAPQERRRMQDIELTVESAYPQGENFPEPTVIGRMGFVALVSNVFLNKPVATRR